MVGTMARVLRLTWSHGRDSAAARDARRAGRRRRKNTVFSLPSTLSPLPVLSLGRGLKPAGIDPRRHNLKSWGQGRVLGGTQGQDQHSYN